MQFRDTFTAKMTLAILAAVIIVGILVAQWIDRRSLDTAPESPHAPQTIIAQIVLAALADPAQKEMQNPQLRQSPQYTTQDHLALRVTTQSHVQEPIEINARLLTLERRVVELDPPSMTLQPGVSTFCCWQIQMPGSYTLQLFRPEGIITSIPVTIKQGAVIPRANVL